MADEEVQTQEQVAVAAPAEEKTKMVAPKAPVFGKYDTTEIVINDANVMLRYWPRRKPAKVIHSKRPTTRCSSATTSA